MNDLLAIEFRRWEREEITTEELLSVLWRYISSPRLHEECVEHILEEDARIFI